MCRIHDGGGGGTAEERCTLPFATRPHFVAESDPSFLTHVSTYVARTQCIMVPTSVSEC